jgi:hypothetical protein
MRTGATHSSARTFREHDRPVAAGRSELVRRALRLEYLTVGWNVLEGVVAVAAALAAGSVGILAFQTTACWWLSVAALVGVGLNGLVGWWWADPAAAMVIALLIGREGREASRGRTCC